MQDRSASIKFGSMEHKKPIIGLKLAEFLTQVNDVNLGWGLV